MNINVRVQADLLSHVRADLARPHSVASERIGFLYGRIVGANSDAPMVVLGSYRPVSNERYIDDPLSGARIDSQAIREAMQGVLDRNSGGFHVHMHDWPGMPVLSRMDIEEIPKVVTALRRVGPSHAHGMILLHQKQCSAWIWLPGVADELKATSVSVIGFPIEQYGETCNE